MRGATYSTPSVTTEFRIQNHSRSCGLQRRGGTGLLAGGLTVLGIPDGNRSLTVAARSQSRLFRKVECAVRVSELVSSPKRLSPPPGLSTPATIPAVVECAIPCASWIWRSSSPIRSEEHTSELQS